MFPIFCEIFWLKLTLRKLRCFLRETPEHLFQSWQQQNFNDPTDVCFWSTSKPSSGGSWQMKVLVVRDPHINYKAGSKAS